MHQTISGETPKKTSVKKLNVNDFRFNHKNIFNELKNKKIFNDNLTYSSQIDENYFNSSVNSIEESHLKAILRKEYIECEKIYPH